MPAGFSFAALAVRCSGLARDARALWRTSLHLDGAGTALALCWELVEQGGIRVQTPPAPEHPLIVTTAQIDGDIMTLVDPDLFKRPSDTWAGLGQQHAAAVRTALAPLSCLPDALRAAEAALLAAITLTNIAFFTSTALLSGRLSARALATELAGSAAVQAGLLILRRSIGRIWVRAVALGLRWRFRGMVAGWRSESHRTMPGLKKRRATRRAAHPSSKDPKT